MFARLKDAWHVINFQVSYISEFFTCFPFEVSCYFHRVVRQSSLYTSAIDLHSTEAVHQYVIILPLDPHDNLPDTLRLLPYRIRYTVFTLDRTHELLHASASTEVKHLGRNEAQRGPHPS